MAKRRSRSVRAQKAPSREYLQLWKIIDGAVRDTFANHPEYLSGRVAEHIVRQSVVKRATGQLWGFAGKPARGRPAVSGRPSA